MNKKKYFMSKDATLKWLETKSVYNIVTDELYEVDDRAFSFFESCTGPDGCTADDNDFLRFSLEEGLLSNARRAVKEIPLRQSPVPSLRYLELQITDRCNLKCRHCYIGKKKCSELSLDTVVDVMEEFEKMQGLRLLITGGEPLMYSEFDSLNSLLSDFAFRTVLFTNGMLLDRKILSKLNVIEIQISIDGLEKAHDYIRGRGAFKKTMQSLKDAIDSGFQTSVSTMIHSKNLDDFDAMERIFKGIGIRDWSVDVPCLSGHLLHNRDLLPPPQVAGKYLRYGFGDGLHGGGSGYVCGLHLMSVLQDGSAAKCAFYSEEPVGHVSEGLERCWKRIEHLPLSEIECDCAFIETCRGGCRYRASVIDGPRAKDPYRCEAFLGTDEMSIK